METIALTLVLFLAAVFVVVPLVMMLVSLVRKARARLQLRRMRRRWLHNNRRRTVTGVSRPFTAIISAANDSLGLPTHVTR